MNSAWLPTGELTSWGLTIYHKPCGRDGGAFEERAKPKLLWHTTEGLGVDNMVDVLNREAAQPHVVIGREGETMKVVQLIPFDRAARALEHPAGTLATNGAHCIQVEICEFARNAHDWPDDFYEGLAALACLIEHRVPIPRRVCRTFKATPAKPARRYTGSGFLRATGHLGHEHAANQPSAHWDPGRFNGRKLLRIMDRIDH